MRPNDQKLRELILYIARRSEGDPRFGKVKLQKILFYADFSHYRRTGTSITGQQYVKWRNGPAIPKVDQLLDELEAQGRLSVATRDYHGYSQRKPLALQEPDLSEFSGEEIARVDAVISELWSQSAQDVSDLSHTFVGWEVTHMNQPIPYETALVDLSPASPEEEEFARRLVEAGR